MVDFIASFFNFDMSVEPPKNRNFSTTTLLTRVNSHVETTPFNAKISELRLFSDDIDRNQSAL